MQAFIHNNRVDFTLHFKYLIQLVYVYSLQTNQELTHWCNWYFEISKVRWIFMQYVNAYFLICDCNKFLGNKCTATKRCNSSTNKGVWSLKNLRYKALNLGQVDHKIGWIYFASSRQIWKCEVLIIKSFWF